MAVPDTAKALFLHTDWVGTVASVRNPAPAWGLKKIKTYVQLEQRKLHQEVLCPLHIVLYRQNLEVRFSGGCVSHWRRQVLYPCPGQWAQCCWVQCPAHVCEHDMIPLYSFQSTDSFE